MREKYVPSDDFPLPKDTPLLPKNVVDAIGTFKRIFKTHQRGTSDFPQPVSVTTKDGRKILAYLEKIFADTASQEDGTFYFDRQTREEDGLRATNFLWGREIDTFTILSDKAMIPTLDPKPGEDFL